MKVARPVPFRFEVAPGVTKGLASLPIPPPFILQEILVIFPTNTSNKLVYRFLQDETGKVPTTGPVGGLDLFMDTVERGEFVGENVAYIVPCHISYAEKSIYFKMQVENGSAYTLIAAAILLIIREV